MVNKFVNVSWYVIYEHSPTSFTRVEENWICCAKIFTKMQHTVDWLKQKSLLSAHCLYWTNRTCKFIDPWKKRWKPNFRGGKRSMGRNYRPLCCMAARTCVATKNVPEKGGKIPEFGNDNCHDHRRFYDLVRVLRDGFPFVSSTHGVSHKHAVPGVNILIP